MIRAPFIRSLLISKRYKHLLFLALKTTFLCSSKHTLHYYTHNYNSTLTSRNSKFQNPNLNSHLGQHVRLHLPLPNGQFQYHRHISLPSRQLPMPGLGLLRGQLNNHNSHSNHRVVAAQEEAAINHSSKAASTPMADSEDTIHVVDLVVGKPTLDRFGG